MNPIYFTIIDHLLFRFIAEDFTASVDIGVNDNVLALGAGDLAFIIDLNRLSQIDTMNLRSLDKYILQQPL